MQRFILLLKKNGFISFLLVTVTLGITSRAIINGTSVALDGFPQVFAIQDSFRDAEGSGDWYCSSVLVAPNLLITAAHCVQPDRVTLGVGHNGSDLGRKRSRGEKARLWRANSHPKYQLPEPGSRMTFMQFMKDASYDIGYIVLKEPLNIPLMPILSPTTPEMDFSFQNQNATLIGYGPNDIRFLTEPYDGFGVKRSGTKPIASVQGNVFLFSGPEQAALPGDSGGAVLVQQNGHWVVGGIISQFQKNGGTYEILAANMLRPEILCWVERTSGVDIPGFTCNQ